MDRPTVHIRVIDIIDRALNLAEEFENTLNTDQRPPITQLGRAEHEDEAGHLRRVANELGGANAGSLTRLRSQLEQGRAEERASAAAALGASGERNAIALLRALLEGPDPSEWELAVHGLRQSRGRAGWLCLESVALDLLPDLETGSSEPDHAFRLLVMGRTKTMDRLFRAVDGHSRSISARQALSFSTVAVNSVPVELANVMSLRLGISNGTAGQPQSPREIAESTGLALDAVRSLEAEAWELVQRPRLYRTIRGNFEANSGGDRTPG